MYSLPLCTRRNLNLNQHLLGEQTTSPLELSCLYGNILHTHTIKHETSHLVMFALQTMYKRNSVQLDIFYKTAKLTLLHLKVHVCLFGSVRDKQRNAT